MGRRGPPPTPSNILRMRGTDRPDRVSPREPQPEIKLPNPPAWLGREGKREWRRLGKLLKSLRVVTELDRMALTIILDEWQEFYELTKAGKNRGKVRDSLMRHLKEFGLTASSRRNIKAQVPPQDEPENPFW